MPKRDIVVIGASAGGREALDDLCSKLPADFPAAIFIVLHVPSVSAGLLPKWLARVCPLRAQYAVDGEAFEPGMIYVAPVDHHLLLERGRMRVTKGPKENRFRPAVDPLFRSAAYAYGARVIGVILSGALNDGTSGLWAIKDRGGVAVVQTPKDAIIAGMPESALENVQVDYTVPASEMAALLAELVARAPEAQETELAPEKLEIEVKYANLEKISEKDVQALGEISEFTCPECHGTLWQLHEGKILRFRCRTGHAYTADALLEDLAESVEAMEWATLRGMQECQLLLQHMADHLKHKGDTDAAERYLCQAADARARAELVRQAIVRDGITQTENGSGTAPV